eukprot:CAMPEP_0172302066 /NCGR_PEP_ID=MMETSP1058-20130122/3829_1 /TAXON_ID=83371 /ORGANISM="Detonula confervacea, Strain CCMP 353" /LENGTH=153 /DNA_ID=CAMNT_0013012413 /DNA_START=619 /DNA_END=1080 /DNA_ORIENTATION=+
MANYYRHGLDGFPTDNGKAFELMTRAAELGMAKACHNLACYYQNGIGTERNKKKEIHFFELAAKKGDIDARFNLGFQAMEKGENCLAVRHWLISAASGCDESFDHISRAALVGMVSKEKLHEVTQQYHMAKDEIKSEKRDEAAAFHERFPDAF